MGITLDVAAGAEERGAYRLPSSGVVQLSAGKRNSNRIKNCQQIDDTHDSRLLGQNRLSSFRAL